MFSNETNICTVSGLN